jgi:hypothetical protein
LAQQSYSLRYTIRVTISKLPIADSIPESARPFFQEYNFASLDPGQHTSLIIERILSYGNRSELHWLAQKYGMDTLRSWLEEHGAARLPHLRYNLWCVVFDLTPTELPSHPWQY